MENTRLPDIRMLSLEDLAKHISVLQKPNYRVKQIYDWLWKKGIRNFESMSNIDLQTRQFLQQNLAFSVLNIDAIHNSSDGTLKFRLKTTDGFLIESVLIPHGSRITMCLSSQIGCSLECKFCATGTMRRKRNLLPFEFFDQACILREYALKHYQKMPTNIVMMGMGEPLLNYHNLLRAVELLTDPQMFAMSPRRITVSTAGLNKQIRQLGDDKVRFQLALSLHATNDVKRNQIMPINTSNNIQSLLESLNYFYQKTRNKITLEYVLLDRFNDSVEDAQSLTKLYRKVPVSLINLIEYNPIIHGKFHPSTEKNTLSFMRILQENGVNVHLRRSKGRDISAACGQLVVNTG